MKIDYEVNEDGPNGDMLLGGFKKNLEIEDLEEFSQDFEEFMEKYRREKKEK